MIVPDQIYHRNSAEQELTTIDFLSKAQDDSAIPHGVGLLNRISKGVGALSLGAAANIVSQISIVPIALYAWGKIRYGEWVVLTGLVSFVKLTDLGLQTFVVNRLCASFARNDRKELQHTLSSAIQVQFPLVSALLLLIASALLIFPLDRVLNLRTIGGWELFAVALLMATELLIGVPMGIIAGVYRATGHLARAGLIGACQQFILIGCTLVLITMRVGFASVVGARVGVGLIFSLLIVWDLNRLYPWLNLSGASGRWRDGVKMIGPGLFFLAIPLADYLSNQFTLMVLQRSLDGGEVSRLATHRTVVNLAQMVSALLLNVVWFELTAFHARAQHEQLIKLHRSLAKLNLWLVGTVTLIMLPCVSWIYPSWTAGRLTVDKWTLVFLVVRMLVLGMWSSSMTLLLAINRQQSVALVLLLTATMTGILAVALVPVMGISGAALAALAGDLCVAAWLVPTIACREIGDSLAGFLGETIPAIVMGIGIPIVVGLAIWFSLPTPLIRYLLAIPLSLGIALVLMWRQLAPYEHQLVAHLYRKVLAHR